MNRLRRVLLRVCLRFKDDGISGIYVGERTKGVPVAVIVCFERISRLDRSASIFLRRTRCTKILGIGLVEYGAELALLTLR